MNRATRKRDRRLKTIKPGIDTTAWGMIKRLLPAIIIGALVWAVITYSIIKIINYRLEGLL